MHDLADLDRRGLPGVMVASDVFVPAHAAQTASLGFDAPVVWVPHPIQDRTDDEMRAMARAALDGVLAGLVTGA